MSSAESSIPSREAQEAKQAAQEALEMEAGIIRLGKMGAVKSNNRNLKAEDEANRRNIEIHERDLWGNDVVDAAANQPSEDEMEIMAARDVIIQQKPEESQPQPQPPLQPKSGINPLHAAIAGIVLSLPAGYMLHDILKGDSADKDTREKVFVGFGDPENQEETSE